VIITPYFIPDESLAKALELAAKRGVKVRILMPRKSNHLLADIARGSFIRQLQSFGVDFHYYPKMIHAKVFMIDQKMALLGSANFDMRSLLLNYELGLLIYDELKLTEIKTWSEARFLNSSVGYKKENFFRGILEGIGRVIGPFI
jgi:cardiolipin synthase